MMDLSQLAVSIDTLRDGEMVIIRPYLEHPAPLTLRYQLDVQQQHVGGQSSINQQGELRAGGLSGSVRLSLPAGASCLVRLQVLQQGRVVLEKKQACESAKESRQPSSE